MQTGNYLDTFVFALDNTFPFEMLQIMCSVHIDYSFTSGINYIDKLAHIFLFYRYWHMSDGELYAKLSVSFE